MKKMLYVMSAILPIVLLANLSEAQAQRKNTTEKDMKAAVEMVDKKDAKIKHWMSEETNEINEDYSKAVKKINKSTFSDTNKEILKTQAQHNKDLMLKQLQDRGDLMMKHWQEREGMRNEMMQSKENRKAVKEVNEILD